jgi:hypothetical protein
MGSETYSHAACYSLCPRNVNFFLSGVVQEAWFGGRMAALILLGEYDFSEHKLQDSVDIKAPKLTD